MTLIPGETPIDTPPVLSPVSPPPYFADIAVSLPMAQTFTYAVPEGLRHVVRVGQRVFVPFGRRKVSGHILGFVEPPDSRMKTKPIFEIEDQEPTFSPKMLEFLRWVSAYYHAPMGEVLRTASPSGVDLKSFRVVQLTEVGRSAVDLQHVETDEAHLLKFLFEQGEVKLSQLQRKPFGQNRVIQRLEREGLLTITENISHARVTIKKEKWVSLSIASGLPEVRGLKQKEILTLLKSQGDVPLKDLLKTVKGNHQTVQKLSERGWIRLFEQSVLRDPLCEINQRTGHLSSGENEGIVLTAYQLESLQKISTALTQSLYKTFLLHGVTGSGKTEVYLGAAAHALKMEKNVIILVPEISLTAQMVSRFYSRFGRQIAIIHSNLSDGERFDEWRRIRSGEVKIVIGARSAIFAPFSTVGLIIVDEEHESAFKQENGVVYQGRDLAVMRAKYFGAVAVLGSATPSIESFYATRNGKYEILVLPGRFQNQKMPEVSLLNLAKEPLLFRKKSEYENEKAQAIFSKRLAKAIESRLEKKEQVILFLNRRGYSPFLLCRDCGEVPKCPQCAISLTHYAKRGVLNCHYCDHTVPVFNDCPQCKGAQSLQEVGFGTESLEEEVRYHFPNAKVARLDRDTTTRKGSHETILNDFSKGQFDILIGTQMVAKGHHFPRVTLVGVILADTALHLPDFRASERTFQLLTQVAGRAGRADLPGEVMVQTFCPDHYSLTYAKHHDFHRFFEHEVSMREDLSFPPFSRLAVLRFLCGDKTKGEKVIAKLEAFLRKVKMQDGMECLEVLGPCEAPLSRLKGQYRWHVIFKSREVRRLHQVIEGVQKTLVSWREFQGVKLQVDVDPYFLM